MKILVIMKRFGTNKDMVMQDFGRQIRLFEPLAKRHIVHFFCPDYTKKESRIVNRKGIKFIVKPLSLFSLISFYRSLEGLIKNGNYDAIVATTDPLIGIIGYHFSKKYRIPFVYDLQDNFEVYGAYRLPFVGYFDKKAVKNADVVFTVSGSLKNLVSGFRKKPIYVIQNGVDLKLFKKADKITARKKLGLPLKAKIGVYVGEMSKVKGAHIMLGAFELVMKKIPNAYLLLCGKVQKGINIKKNGVIFKDFKSQKDVVVALNAADVALIPNLENEFSKYCFPCKVLEYMSISLPIVATGVGDVSVLLKKYHGSLCKPDNKEDLAEKMIAKIKIGGNVSYKAYLDKLNWAVLAEKVGSILNQLK